MISEACKLGREGDFESSQLCGDASGGVLFYFYFIHFHFFYFYLVILFSFFVLNFCLDSIVDASGDVIFFCNRFCDVLDGGDEAHDQQRGDEQLHRGLKESEASH